MRSETAQVVLTGGRVWTGPAMGAPVTALAVRNGRILATGSDRDVEALCDRRTRRIALEGGRVLPGLHDAHLHLAEGGLLLAGVSLRDVDSRDEFIAGVAAAAAGRDPARWITGGLWNHERWGGRLPDRSWIDAVTHRTPAFLPRADLHMALVNAVALERAGITDATPDPPGGQIVRDASGRPTGLLKDTAQELVRAVMPPPTADDYRAAVREAARLAARHGLTHVTDMGWGSAGSWGGLEACRALAAAGELPVRVYGVVPIADGERLAEYIAANGPGDDRVRWGAVKGFVDGSLGSATAWMAEPYADLPGETGLRVTDSAELRWQILEAHRAGLHVIIHAIGDRANDWLLDAYAEARDAAGAPARPFRIEHAQHLSPRAIRRFGREGVVASVQPAHLADDGCWAERRLGARIGRAWPLRALLDHGAVLAGGSDWPVATIDPLAGIRAAVTRHTADGRHPGGWVPEQRITAIEAVAAYTEGAARAAGLAPPAGTLQPGAPADLVVLSRDILSADPDDLASARVDLAMVGGEIVFGER